MLDSYVDNEIRDIVFRCQKSVIDENNRRIQELEFALFQKKKILDPQIPITENEGLQLYAESFLEGRKSDIPVSGKKLLLTISQFIKTHTNTSNTIIRILSSKWVDKKLLAAEKELLTYYEENFNKVHIGYLQEFHPEEIHDDAAPKKTSSVRSVLKWIVIVIIIIAVVFFFLLSAAGVFALIFGIPVVLINLAEQQRNKNVLRLQEQIANCDVSRYAPDLQISILRIALDSSVSHDDKIQQLNSLGVYLRNNK